MDERTITVCEGTCASHSRRPKEYVSAREGAPQPVWVRPFRAARAIPGSSGGSARARHGAQGKPGLGMPTGTTSTSNRETPR
jgi:hypothetical protein